MTQPMTVRGKNGTIVFDGYTVTIQRTGFLARATVGKGEKQIPVGSITAIQVKPGGLVNGFIQFTLAGGNERRSRFGSQSRDAVNDENSVMFDYRQNKVMAALRDAILAAQRRPQQQPQQVDIAGQLAQLAALYEQRALTWEQYEQAKARILGG